MKWVSSLGGGATLGRVVPKDGGGVGGATTTANINGTDSRDSIGEYRRRAEVAEQFVAVLAHELRSAVAGIRGHAETVAEEWDRLDPPTRQRSVETTATGTVELSALVEQLVELAYPDSGPPSVSVEPVLHAVARLDRPANGLTIECPRELRASVRAVDLRLVVANLVRNAFSHGRPPVVVEATDVSGTVEVRVTDSGDGVPSEVVPHLFRPIAPDDPARRGHGVGLAMARDVAVRAGGDVRHEPAAEGGATFVVSLPGELHRPHRARPVHRGNGTAGQPAETVPSMPLVDLVAQHHEVAMEIERGFERVMERARFVGGEEVAAFEHEFAAFSDVDQCIGVANGTDALELVLRAMGVGRDDEVIVPVNTFAATAEAVVTSGASVVFVDCDAHSLLVDPEAVAAAVTPRTVAIIPVHLYGQAAPMDPILEIARRHELFVIEDAAQAQGARHAGRAVGTFGAAAGTSFYPGKNLGAYGDAGAVLTTNAALASQVRMLANHGSASKYEHRVPGVNSRLDALQAVVLRAKLRRLAAWNAARVAAADRYAALLDGIDGITLPRTAVGNSHVWHLYVVRVHDGRRDATLGALQAAGIDAGIHYPVPLHRQPAFESPRHRYGGVPRRRGDGRRAALTPAPSPPGRRSAGAGGHGDRQRLGMTAGMDALVGYERVASLPLAIAGAGAAGRREPTTCRSPTAVRTTTASTVATRMARSRPSDQFST